jgi:signal transduction histidine kinase
MKTCPSCSKNIENNVDQCPYCDSDVSNVLPTTAEESGVPSSPEQLVPRLGDLLLAKNMVTEDEIDRAIHFQKKARDNGRDVLLGEALVHLGSISKKQLDLAVTEQVIQLQDALRQSNAELEKRVLSRTFELQEALDKLTSLNKLKSDFIANISHELRTPMAHIIGYVDLLRDESLGELNQDQIMALDTIVKANNRIMLLLDDLLQFNGFAENTMTIHPEAFYLKEMISDVQRNFKSLNNEKKIHFITEFTEDGLKINADREKITWVIDQLLENAMKFSKLNGMIKLKVSKKQNLAHFQIVDNGIGIPEDKLDLIFEAFVQLESSLRIQNGGTGIGLTIVKQIIEAHGSRIKVNSILNKGTVFEFYLPIS